LRLFAFYLRLLMLVGAAVLPGYAQLTSPNSPGAIAGTVADPTGAVIPQATVTASRR